MEPLHSASWYRVAELRPRLSTQVRFARHVYRGEVWYVLRNRLSGKIHRLTPQARTLVQLMNGERTLQEVWELALTNLGDDAPPQDETLRLLGTLYAADALRCDVSPDIATLLRGVEEKATRAWWRTKSPIAFRVPLLDPNAFLERWQSLARPILSPASGALWCAVVLAAGFVAASRSSELAAATRGLFEPAALLALWFSVPVVKALHELGHAFAVKRWGGEVHEMGILFLVLLPVPYVDASAASAFPEKQRRMVVSGMGIAVELLLAALATFVWIAVEPGLVRHIAFAVMLVGGGSSLFVNGNPLLRFDGYYVLADAIEIPNLASKANQYLAGLAKRRILGMRQAPLPDTTPGEPAWLIGYAIGSFVYRILVVCGIALYLAGRFFALGVLLAAGTLLTRIALPLLRHGHYVLTDPAVGAQRGRALAGGLGLLAVCAALLFALPVPLRTQSEGVVWLPERSHLRAGADGFVDEVLAEPNRRVEPDQPLIRIANPSLEARVRTLEAERKELAVRVHALTQSDRVEAEIMRERLSAAEAALARIRQQADDVLVRSPARGVFVMAEGEDLLGRYVRQGDVVGYVVDLSTASARVVVHQQDVALLREHTAAAWARLAHDLGRVHPVRITRQVPTATQQLPTRSLGTAGGGPIPVDPMDPEGLRTLERVFELELAFPPDTPLRGAGERVYVRFDHGAEPVGWRGYRALRRLFLRQLGV